MLYDHFLSAKSPEMNKGTQRYKDISWLTTPPTHAVVWALRPPTYTSRCAGTRLHGASVDLPRQCSDGIIGELMSGDCKMFVGSGEAAHLRMHSKRLGKPFIPLSSHHL